MNRKSISALLIVLILFSIGQAFTKFRIISEFDTYYTVNGTLDRYFNKGNKSNLFYFKLKEYPTIFKIGHFEIKAFDRASFSELYAGDKITVTVEPSARLATTVMTTPGQISAYGKSFIDQKVRDAKWRSEGWAAVFFSFLFTIGLIHHLKRPWV